MNACGLRSLIFCIICAVQTNAWAESNAQVRTPQFAPQANLPTPSAAAADSLRSYASTHARQARSVNVLDFIPAELHAGILDRTNVTPLQTYIQAALDAASDYRPVMKGLQPVDELDFGDTLRQPQACSVYFPIGAYRITDRIFLPPHCKIYGEKAGENWSRTGSCIEVRIDNPHAYAVQVKQFGKDGKLLIDHAGQPDEPNRGIATNGEGIEICDLTFTGDFKCKGISLNSWYCGSVENVTLWNFIVGLRTMNSWCSSLEDVHITASWRGLILNGVNIIDLRNVYLSHEGEFQPDDDYRDGSEGPRFGNWSWERQRLSAAVYAVWSVCASQALTIDGTWDVGFSLMNSKTDAMGVYAESIQRVVVQAACERDYGGVSLRFADLRTDQAALVWNQGARITLAYDAADRVHRYRQLYEFVDSQPANSQPFPVVWTNFAPKPDDAVDHGRSTRTPLVDRMNFDGGVYHYYVDPQQGRPGFTGKSPDDPLTDMATALRLANIPGAVVHVHLKRGENYALRSQVRMATSKIVIDSWGNGPPPNVELALESGGPAVDLVHPGEATLSCSDLAFHLPSPGQSNGSDVVARSVGGQLHALFSDCIFRIGEKNGVFSHAGRATTYRILFSNCAIDGHERSFGALSAANDDRPSARHRVFEHAFETRIDPHMGGYDEKNAEIIHSDLLGIVSLPLNLPTRPPLASGRLWIDPNQGHVLKMTPRP